MSSGASEQLLRRTRHAWISSAERGSQKMYGCKELRQKPPQPKPKLEVVLEQHRVNRVSGVVRCWSSFVRVLPLI